MAQSKSDQRVIVRYNVFLQVKAPSLEFAFSTHSAEGWKCRSRPSFPNSSFYLPPSSPYGRATWSPSLASLVRCPDAMLQSSNPFPHSLTEHLSPPAFNLFSVLSGILEAAQRTASAGKLRDRIEPSEVTPSGESVEDGEETGGSRENC